MMKKYMILLAAAAMMTDASAQSMAEILGHAPDTLFAYLDAKQRAELAEYSRVGMGGEVTHQLQGASKLDTLTADYLHLTLSESSTIEIKKLPYRQADSILCVVRTWKTPEEESMVSFYTKDWLPVRLAAADDTTRTFAIDRLPLTRPDTMSVADFDKTLANTDFILTSAHLAADDNNLRIQRSAPLAPAEDKQRLKAIFKTAVLRWDGYIYK